MEGERSGGGVWTWSLRSDRGGAEGSGHIHVWPLGGDSPRGGLPRRSRRGQALTAVAGFVRQMPRSSQAACDYLLTPLRENAVAVQALPLQPAIGGHRLHRRKDRAVRHSVLRSESPKGSWSPSAAGQSPESSITDAHTAPGDDDLPPFPTGESTAEHPDRRVPVSNPRHVAADDGARDGGDSRQHPWRSVSSWPASSHGESVQVGIRKSRQEDGGVQEVRAQSGRLPRNSCRAWLPVINAERKHCRVRGGRILIPTPHDAGVFCRRSRRSSLHPQSEQEHQRSRLRARSRRRLRPVLAIREWHAVRRRVWAPTERNGGERSRFLPTVSIEQGDKPSSFAPSTVSRGVFQPAPWWRKPKCRCHAHSCWSSAGENPCDFQRRPGCSKPYPAIRQRYYCVQPPQLQFRWERWCRPPRQPTGVHSTEEAWPRCHEQFDRRSIWFSQSPGAEQDFVGQPRHASFWRTPAGATASHQKVHQFGKFILRITSADQRISFCDCRDSTVPSQVDCVGIVSKMDDGGFKEIATTLCDMGARLRQLKLYRSKLSATLLRKILSSLPYLSFLTLVGNPVGDDGFHQVSMVLQRRNLLSLHLCDIGLTCQSLGVLEKILASCPNLKTLRVYCQKKTFPPLGEDFLAAAVGELPAMRLKQKEEFQNPTFEYGYRCTDRLKFQNKRNQSLYIHFVDWNSLRANFLRMTCQVSTVLSKLFSTAKQIGC